MAIKMDGNTITSLLLKASDGSQVTKTLTESGVINTPTATKTITENGEVDVLNFAKAIVNVSSGGSSNTDLVMRTGKVSPEGITRLYVPIEDIPGKKCFAMFAQKTTVVSETSPIAIAGWVNGGLNATSLDNFRGTYCVLSNNEDNVVEYTTGTFNTSRTDSKVREGYVSLDRPTTTNSYNVSDEYSYILFYL